MKQNVNSSYEVVNSGMHSHCFVNLDCNFHPFDPEFDIRQSYRALMCFNNLQEVRKFYSDFDSSLNSQESDEKHLLRTGYAYSSDTIPVAQQ